MEGQDNPGYSSDNKLGNMEKDILLMIWQAYIREIKDLLPFLKKQLKHLSFQNYITIANSTVLLQKKTGE